MSTCILSRLSKLRLELKASSFIAFSGGLPSLLALIAEDL
jgi:hypothetical protein